MFEVKIDNILLPTEKVEDRIEVGEQNQKKETIFFFLLSAICVITAFVIKYTQEYDLRFSLLVDILIFTFFILIYKTIYSFLTTESMELIVTNERVILKVKNQLNFSQIKIFKYEFFESIEIKVGFDSFNRLFAFLVAIIVTLFIQVVTGFYQVDLIIQRIIYGVPISLVIVLYMFFKKYITETISCKIRLTSGWTVHIKLLSRSHPSERILAVYNRIILNTSKINKKLSEKEEKLISDKLSHQKDPNDDYIII